MKENNENEMQRGLLTPKPLPNSQCFENSREEDLLQAIVEDQLDKVTQLLKPDSPPVNLNYTDTLGRTPLMLATEKEQVNEQLVQLLVESGADTESALMYEMGQRNRQAFAVLLQYCSKIEDILKKKTNPKELNFLSPLMLAIKLGDFEMITQLMSQGYEVLEHHIKCSCIHCTSADTVMAKSLIRLESYRALANPLYNCAQYIMNSNNDDNSKNRDPIHTAFVLSTKMKHQAITDYEFKDDYMSLYEVLNNFSVSLLEYCQNIEEVQVVMDTCENPDKQNIPDEARHLGMLDSAIAHQNEQFIAHPFSQIMLNYEVYRKYPETKNISPLVKYFATILLVAIFPVWTFCYLFLPNSHVTRLLRTPLIKCGVFMGSYQVFLFLISLTVFQSEKDFLRFSMSDWLVLLFIIGFCLDIGKEIYRSGRKRYFSTWYNCVLVATNVSFVMYYAIWAVGFFGLLQSCPDPTCSNASEAKPFTKAFLLSYCFYSLGVLLSFSYFLSIFHFSPTLGPLLMALLKMLKDVVNFFMFFVVLFFAFVFCLSKLYWQYFQAIKDEKFASVYPASNTSSVRDHPMKSSFTGSFIATFWSLFGRVQLSDFSIAEDYYIMQFTALSFFGLFNVLAVVLALNMLIAMLNESFSNQASSADIKWKYTRTKMMFSLIYKSNVLPPPLNLIPTPRAILFMFQKIRKLFFCQDGCCSRSTFNDSRAKSRAQNKLSQRRKTMTKLIWRYLSSQERTKGAKPLFCEELHQEQQDEPGEIRC